MRRSTVTNEAEIKHKKGVLRTKDSAFAFCKYPGTLTIENWNIYAKEFENPLFHKI